MPIPYYPSDDPEEVPAPDIDGIIQRILHPKGRRSPPPASI
ncbi:hypothetical protein [Haladaptatus litoreus]|nr:hypothetical protein [Haladaptatus litoreus]